MLIDCMLISSLTRGLQDPAVESDPLEGWAEVTDAADARGVGSPADDVNVWSSKPLWCQPWTIVGTGATVILLAWKASGGSVLITGAVAFPVFIWWYLFLGVRQHHWLPISCVHPDFVKSMSNTCHSKQMAHVRTVTS